MTLQTPAESAQVALPSIRIDVFAEDQATLDSLVALSRSPNAGRQKWTILKGALSDALDRYKTHPSPDLIVFQTDHDRVKLLLEVETLARACDPKTRAVVIGCENDIGLFRTLQHAGVSDYLTRPIDPEVMADTILATFRNRTAARDGRISAFIGVCGGCGSSTVAQNVAAALVDHTRHKVLLADLDLQGGTVKLNFDDRGSASLNEVLQQADRMDGTLLERLATERSARLRLLTCEPDLKLSRNLPVPLLDHLLGLAMHSANHLVLDLPRHWSEQAEDILRQADDIVLTTTADLVGLRNFRLVMERLSGILPHHRGPFVVINQVRTPGRTEVPIDEFSKSGSESGITTLPFDARAFSRASAKGRTLVESSKTGVHQRAFHALARQLASPTTAPTLEPVWSRLRRDLKKWW